MVKTDFIKNCSYAVRQNCSSSDEDMRQALQTVVEHMFWNHHECGQWCRYGKVDNYQHSGLPHSKDHTSDTLRCALHDVLLPFAENHQKFITGGSTQANESLNNAVWSKRPKCKNYNMSESFDYRCAASVCSSMRECHVYIPFAPKLLHHENKRRHIKLMKGKAPRKHSLHEKTAASVLLKLFISSNEWCHTTDAP